jgi:acid phosphatase (class A)
MILKKTAIFGLLLVAGVAASTLAQTAPTVPNADNEVALKAARSRLGAGYLKPDTWPDSLALLPPPPTKGSRALRRDQKLQVRAVAAQSTARWIQAKTDADIFVPNATATMSCAAGIDISAANTPAIDKLLRRTMADFGSVTAKAKNHYKRPRPFMVNNMPVCTPDFEKILRSDGSYPSGHATIGYGWGMILAKIIPARKGRLIARGRAFAESRRFCNVHWQSDVEAGIALSKPVLAKLLAEPGFLIDLAAARAEAKANTTKPQNCAAEKTALAMH